MARRTTTVAQAPVVAGIRLSHPHRLIYPELGLTKQQLAEYYVGIGDWILPHIAGRPLTLVHCPAGLSAPCRYLRHAKAWGPSALRRVRIREKTKTGEYLIADSVTAVVALAQMGIVEIHTWNSVFDDLERPNRIVWDLDPGPDVKWADVVACARLLREILDVLELRAWAKTTGGRGLHVVVPIRASLDWVACLDFAAAVSEALARSRPGRLTTAFAKRGREDKILIDYMRNNRTNTSICAYSPRARDGAPVSTPITWEEITTRPQHTLLTVPRRLGRLRHDPWRDYWSSSHTISTRVRHAVSRL
jgi:bifunctional non-homologous end joining protein LigD